MDKKFYLEPEMEILNIQLEGALLDASIPENDGEVGGNIADPSDPDWGSDY
ncbi:MAG: hypothetical protein IJP82_03180 [Bacteroidaceae bacterium]|nr:hypothetical protein [Bacteroidaceae bacterium]